MVPQRGKLLSVTEENQQLFHRSTRRRHGGPRCLHSRSPANRKEWLILLDNDVGSIDYENGGLAMFLTVMQSNFFHLLFNFVPNVADQLSMADQLWVGAGQKSATKIRHKKNWDPVTKRIPKFLHKTRFNIRGG